MMPYELFIALRYLKAKRKQVVISIITLIAIGAVAAGVASLVIVLAMMTGFREEFQTRILSGTAHLNLMRTDGRPIEDYRELMDRLGKLPNVHATSATLYNRVLIQGKSDTDGAILKGADLSAPGETSEILQFTVEGDPRSLASPEIDPESGIKIDRIILGSDLAQTLGLQIGDIATIISPKGHLTPMGMSPNYKDFRVAGIFKSGLRDYDATWAYISLEAAQRLSGAKDVAEIIQMKVDDIDRVKQIGRDVLATAGKGFAVQDWQQLNAPIYTALSYEKYFSGGALMIVIGIAALNIITILVMIVMEKQRDISVLKSMGATSRSIMLVFMIQGLVIGIIGMLAGIAIGEAFCAFAQGRQLIKLPEGAYALDYLPFHAQVTDLLMVAAISVAISFLSTLYPSWSASRLDPVEGLRYE